MLEIPYSGIVSLRNWAYDHQYLKTYSVGIPVISVGNLTAGGTGKTPVVQFLCCWLKEIGYRPAVIMRGYGSSLDLAKNYVVADERGLLVTQEEAGDEAAQLAQNLPGIPIWIGANRVISGQKAIELNRANILIMDDGFQHRKLFRDMDILLIDALRPWGYAHVLPRGLLREPVSNLRRADVILITRSDLCSEEELQSLEKQIYSFNKGVQIFRTSHKPNRIVELFGEEYPIQTGIGKKAHFFCGLGNPDGFFQTASEAGFVETGRTLFPDHYPYQQKDLLELEEKAKKEKAQLLLTTEKDGIKLKKFAKSSIPVWQLSIEVFFEKREEQLKNVIMKKCTLK